MRLSWQLVGQRFGQPCSIGRRLGQSRRSGTKDEGNETARYMVQHESEGMEFSERTGL